MNTQEAGIAEIVIPLLFTLVKDISSGALKTAGDIARRIVGIGLAVVPHDELAQYLTSFGKEHAELLGDIAEDAKFDDHSTDVKG